MTPTGLFVFAYLLCGVVSVMFWFEELLLALSMEVPDVESETAQRAFRYLAMAFAVVAWPLLWTPPEGGAR